MLYNNKKTLSALALILGISIAMTNSSYAQGVVTLVEDGMDEIGIPSEPVAKQDKTVKSPTVQPTSVAVADTKKVEAQNKQQSQVTAKVETNTVKTADAPKAPVNIAKTDEIANIDIPLESDYNKKVDELKSVNKEIVKQQNKAPATVKQPGVNPSIPAGNPAANKPLPAKKEAIKKVTDLGNATLSQIDNDLFSQMSDIEKQTTLLTLELRREKLKSEIAAIKAAQQAAEDQAEEEKLKRAQREKDKITEKEIEKIKEEQLLKNQEIALETLRQEKAINDFRNKLLESEQKWISENEALYTRLQEMEEERKSLIEEFENKIKIITDVSSKTLTKANEASQKHAEVVANLNMQNDQLRKRLEAETSVGNNPLSKNQQGEINNEPVSKDYIIMEIRGKEDNLEAKLINKDGKAFLVRRGSALQSGHTIEKITQTYITLDLNGQKDYLQLSGATVLEKEPEKININGLAGEASKKNTKEDNRPKVLSDEILPSLGSGMFLR